MDGKISREDDEQAREAAYDYIRKLGLEPTPDAIGQLSGPFTSALEKMCTRGYPNEFWKTRGWRGIVHNILNKSLRIKARSWRRREFAHDDAIDLINECGFYWRMENKGQPWGELGEPG
jgi:hypothetical protein